MMTTKEQILQELEQVPELILKEVLEFVRDLKAKHNDIHPQQSDVWQAYLESKKQREEVYRRLANS